MTTSELLPDSLLFSQTFFISSFRRTLNIHEHTHRPRAEGCVKLHAFEVERVNWWAVSVGGEELKWCQLAHHQLMSQKKEPCSRAKANYKSTISGKLVTSGK